MDNHIQKSAMAAFLGISERTLENWVANRGFPAPRHIVGSHIAFFKVTEVEAWLVRELERGGLL